MTKTTWDSIRETTLGPEGETSSTYRREMTALEFGDFIRDAREVAGLTQVELGRRLDISQPAVARLEAGSSLPSLTTLTRIADALKGRLRVELDVEDSEGQIRELASPPL